LLLTLLIKQNKQLFHGVNINLLPEKIPAGHLLGWYKKDNKLPLIVKDEQDNNKLTLIFYLQDGEIYTKETL